MELKLKREIIVNLSNFGEVKLRSYVVRDFFKLQELLEKSVDDRFFTAKFIFNQLKHPHITFDKFTRISDEELICLARSFVESDLHTFKYFSEINSESFFKDFKVALCKYYQEQIGKTKNISTPQIPSVLKEIDNLKKSWSIFEDIRQTIKSTSHIQELVQNVTSAPKYMQQFQNSVFKQYQYTTRFLSDYLKPVDSLFRWVEHNNGIFDSIGKYWYDFQDRYRIAENKAFKILKKYKWFVTPSLPLSFVFEVVKQGSKKGNQRKTINKLFIDYFYANNFVELENFLATWSTNPIFKPRIKILKDCVIALKESRQSNAANVILPTLIAQIEGIFIELCKQKVGVSLKKTKWIDKNGTEMSRKNLENLVKTNFKSNDLLLDLTIDFYFVILFQTAYHGQSLSTPFTFNRHKIMHGENLRYGRHDNVIRAFLVLDFLDWISK